MLLDTRIYCIEGHWDYGKKETEPSVEPILQMLRVLGHWDYARRDCATVMEMDYWIEQEWTSRCREGSVLYFATHGECGEISLSTNQPPLPVTEITANCTNCWVHFGGCNVLDVPKKTIREFMERSGAVVVSGYTAEIAWANTNFAPALALELVLFSSIADIPLYDGRSRRRLKSIAESLGSRFEDCGFRLHTKESMAL